MFVWPGTVLLTSTFPVLYLLRDWLRLQRDASPSIEARRRHNPRRTRPLLPPENDINMGLTDYTDSAELPHQSLVKPNAPPTLRSLYYIFSANGAPPLRNVTTRTGWEGRFWPPPTYLFFLDILTHAPTGVRADFALTGGRGGWPLTPPPLGRSRKLSNVARSGKRHSKAWEKVYRKYFGHFFAKVKNWRH